MVQPIVRQVLGVVVIAIMVIVVAIGAAEAVTIDLGPGTLDAFLLFDFSSNLLAFDVRGTQSFIVSNPGLVGFVLVTDMFDLVTPAPFPNSALLAKNAAFDQSAVLVFDPANMDFSGADLFVRATGLPIGPVTDPALRAFLSNDLKFFFVFDPAGSAVDPSAGLVLLDFNLVRVAIANPASLLLLVLGAFAPALIRIRFRR
jgi:hypothetical protein